MYDGVNSYVFHVFSVSLYVYKDQDVFEPLFLSTMPKLNKFILISYYGNVFVKTRYTCNFIAENNISFINCSFFALSNCSCL